MSTINDGYLCFAFRKVLGLLRIVHCLLTPVGGSPGHGHLICESIIVSFACALTLGRDLRLRPDASDLDIELMHEA